MSLRIGLVTDIHSGPDMDTRLGSKAFPILDRFVEEMARRFKPDLVVDLGDRTNDVDAKTDAERIRILRSWLQSVGVPVLFVYGNHDLINVGAAEQQSLLGKKADFESLDFRGFHIMLLNSQDPTFGGVGGTLSDAQLEWLEADLRNGEGGRWWSSATTPLMSRTAASTGIFAIIQRVRPRRQPRARPDPVRPLRPGPGHVPWPHALEPYHGDRRGRIRHGTVAGVLFSDRRPPASRRVHRSDRGRDRSRPSRGAGGPADDLLASVTGSLPIRGSTALWTVGNQIRSGDHKGRRGPPSSCPLVAVRGDVIVPAWRGRASSHAKYDCRYHFVWCPNRRWWLGDPGIRADRMDTFRAIVEEFGSWIEKLAIRRSR